MKAKRYGISDVQPFQVVPMPICVQEGDGCTRKWSAELSPVAKDLLLTYAKWYAIDTLQSITM